ncbi:hypothetical protein BJP39_28710 [Streptomyces sp. CC77]|nr:hypothetical protein BJP39_28710 [Streptomyces sp. CC77]
MYAQAGGVAAGVLLLWLLWPSGEPGGVPAAPHGAIRSQAPASSAPARKQAAVPSPRPSVSASPTAPPPSPSPSASRPAAPPVEQRLTDLVNARRARAGCGPLRLDPRLTAAARAHARDMVARGYFDHADPEGRHADARIADAGYRASAWAENLHRGPRDAATVVEDWMDGSVHEENMLGCTYRDTGVAAVPGPDGTVWVQTLAGPVGR